MSRLLQYHYASYFGGIHHISLIKSAPKMKSEDYTKAFVAGLGRLHLSHENEAFPINSTALSMAGFTFKQKIICPHCHFEPNLNSVKNCVRKGFASINLCLLVEHLSNTKQCPVLKSCFELFLLSTKSNTKPFEGVTYCEFDRDRYLRPAHPSMVDPLDFKCLEKRCKDPRNMQSARARLLSFIKWRPSEKVDPLALAWDGFYRYKDAMGCDSVKCAYCSVVLYQWEAGDIVSREHTNKSPNCPFKNGHLEDIPLNEVEVLYHRCVKLFSDISVVKSKISDSDICKIKDIIQCFKKYPPNEINDKYLMHIKGYITDWSPILSTDAEDDIDGILEVGRPNEANLGNVLDESTLDLVNSVSIDNEVPIEEVENAGFSNDRVQETQNQGIRDIELAEHQIHPRQPFVGEHNHTNDNVLPFRPLMECRGCSLLPGCISYRQTGVVNHLLYSKTISCTDCLILDSCVRKK